MKIGIIGAMEMEVAVLKNEMHISQTVSYAGMEFCEGTIGNADVVIVRSGVGKVNAGICVQILVDRFSVTHILNTGVAGSLNNSINIGDIVVSRDAMYHDVDATVFGYQPGEVPQLGTVAFSADPFLVEKAVSACQEADPDIQVLQGRIVSGDQFICDHAVKAKLASEFHGDCCEMEGAAIAQASFINKIPFVIIRAISDKADESVQISYTAFEEKAAMHCAALVKYMIENIRN